MMAYITTREAAARLSIGERTLSRMIQRGAFPAYRIGPHLIRIKEEDLEAYVAGRLVAPQPAEPAKPARPCRYVPGMKVV